MREQKLIEQRFIEEFVRQIILNYSIKEDRLTNDKPLQVNREVSVVLDKLKQYQERPSNLQAIVAPKIIKPINITQSNKIFPASPQRPLSVKSMEKLSPILYDQSVQTIECPGAGKQIIVTRNGLMQVSNISLTSDEISSILKEISEKTRIPIISGFFKAAFEDIIITAILSEFIGTKFIIQKRRPTRSPAR